MDETIAIRRGAVLWCNLHCGRRSFGFKICLWKWCKVCVCLWVSVCFHVFKMRKVGLLTGFKFWIFIDLNFAYPKPLTCPSVLGPIWPNLNRTVCHSNLDPLQLFSLSLFPRSLETTVPFGRGFSAWHTISQVILMLSVDLVFVLVIKF